MKKRFLKENTKNTLLILSVNIFAIMTLAFAVLSFKDIIRDENSGVNTIYLGLAFISLGLTKFNGFFIAEKRIEKIRAITLLVYNVAISILAFFAANDYRLFFIVSGLYILSIIISINTPSISALIWKTSSTAGAARFSCTARVHLPGILLVV